MTTVNEQICQLVTRIAACKKPHDTVPCRRPAVWMVQISAHSPIGLRDYETYTEATDAPTAWRLVDCLSSSVGFPITPQ